MLRKWRQCTPTDLSTNFSVIEKEDSKKYYFSFFIDEDNFSWKGSVILIKNQEEKVTA